MHSNIISYSRYNICEAYYRTPYGHLIPRKNLTGQEIKSLIKKFGVNNQGLAVKNKKTKAVVTIFVSNCNSKSDRLVSIISDILSSLSPKSSSPIPNPKPNAVKNPKSNWDWV